MNSPIGGGGGSSTTKSDGGGGRKNTGRRRWRQKAEIGVAKHQHRTVDIDDFVRRRRRYVVVDRSKCRRRLQRLGEDGQTATGVAGMGSPRIALEV